MLNDMLLDGLKKNNPELDICDITENKGVFGQMINFKS